MLILRHLLTTATLLLIMACLIGSYVLIGGMLQLTLLSGAWLLTPLLLWVDRTIACRLERQVLAQTLRSAAQLADRSQLQATPQSYDRQTPTAAASHRLPPLA